VRLAVIPARGGSKRIPRKNVREFCGRPIIAWAIGAAERSGKFDRIVVSTDDEEIAAVAREWGAETPFVRPSELSDDRTPTVPVVAHAIRSCRDAGWNADYVCCVYPCAPFLMPSDLSAALRLVEQGGAEFAYPVTEYAHPTQRAMRRLASGKMQFLDEKHELTRTQDLEKTFHDAGQFYWGKASAWLQQKRMHVDGVGMPVPNWRVVDIDTEEDWKRAEQVFKLIGASQ
jgi:pseudaminic acid cytidylyltransferase